MEDEASRGQFDILVFPRGSFLTSATSTYLVHEQDYEYLELEQEVINRTNTK